MDFGFGSLVDKFEERIGRKATSALLWLAAAALLVVCIKTIISEGVIPFVDFVRGVSSQTTQSMIAGLIFGFAIAMASGVVFGVVVRLIAARSAKQAASYVAKAKETVKQAELQIDEYIRRNNEQADRTQDLIEKAEEMTRLAVAREREVRKLLDEARQLAESVQANDGAPDAENGL